MSQSQAHPAQKYLELREKNIAFFQQRYPGIYHFFNQYKMQSAKTDILPEVDDVDIFIDGKHLYQGKAKTYAKREVATFLANYDYGSKINSFAPLERNVFKNQRFFAQSMSALADYYHDKCENFDGYQLKDFFPLVVFMGVGLGKHINVLTQIRKISHAMVFETDMDRFAASLYAVDWELIVQPFLDDTNRSFRFLLIPEPQSEDQLHGTLWNNLLTFCPIFPITTLFYNHLGNPIHDRITDRVNDDLYMQLLSFGNVDDELNQINSALHNFKQQRPLSAPQTCSESMPVCIVGSGPSLDSRIEELKSLQGKALIISCGTALRALWTHGIKPDIQIELESDFYSYQVHNMLEDKDFMKSVRLIAAAQVNPMMFSLFGDSRIFFKSDGSLAHWFARDQSIIANATPTCTNAALAIAFYLKHSPIFLFGLDYGFPEKEAHHAAGAAYYQKGVQEHYTQNQETITITSVSGGSILSTPFLYSAKRRIENSLASAGNQVIYNCSNGAHLENTQWLPTGKATTLVKTTGCKKDYIKSLFNDTDPLIEATKVSLTKAKLLEEIKSIINTLTDMTDKFPLTSVHDFSDLCSCTLPLIAQLQHDDRGMFYFIRGSIWHFLLAGYTHVYSLPAEEVKSYLKVWKKHWTEMLAMLGQRFQTIMSNRLSMEDDSMVNHCIWEPIQDEQK